MTNFNVADPAGCCPRCGFSTGRHRIPDRLRRRNRIQTLVRDETNAQLKELAKIRQKSISDLAYQILDEYLSQWVTVSAVDQEWLEEHNLEEGAAP